MKILIASDIHGSAFYTKKLMEIFQKEKPDKLLLLGDILYHGARNPLPKDYDTMSVFTLLNSIKNDIICVRGNCDSEVDQMVLDFPITADYTTLLYQSHCIFATHGHVYGNDRPPVLKEGDILLHGHTHIATMEKNESGWYYINPGSASIPKGDGIHSYMIFEEGVFIRYDFEGNELDKLCL